MMAEYLQIIQELKSELLQSLDYLEYSYNKISRLNLSTKSTDPEDFETFEALVSRFARVTDIFLAKYLRALAYADDPAFRGSLRDWVNYAEKNGVINSTSFWMEIRELRNKIAHEYAANDLSDIFEKVIANTPDVLKIKASLK
jgi:hypothetical protein